jgi:hypothetical protein
MENKSTLGPLFVLSFLIMIVLICILFSISSIMLGSAYSFYQISKEGNIIMPSDKPQIESTQTIQLTPPQILETIPLIEFTILPEIPSPTVEPSFTPIPTETLLPKVELLPTEVPTQTSLPTATFDQKAVEMTKVAQATAQVEWMMEYVDQLFGNGIIHSKSGVYHNLPIYANESANPATFNKFSTGLFPKDFILRTDINWQVDQNQGDWIESGCGVVFRDTDPGNFYLVYLSLDGRARLKRSIDNSLILLGRSTIFDVDRQNGQAQLVLIVEGEMIRIFVNGAQKFEKPGIPQAGDLSFTVVTGNPYGYGTRCKMNNIEIWEIEPQ